MWDHLKEKLEDTTALLLAGAAFLTISSKYRRALVKGWRGIRDRMKRGRRIDGTIAKLADMVHGIDARVSDMHYQLHPNGGNSLKDEVKRIGDNVGFLLEVHNLSYRVLPYPAFRCEADGKNSYVSEAYQQLLGLRDDADLSNLNWHGFIHQDDIEAYAHSFTLASQSHSNFRFSARFQRSKNHPLGRWMVEANRLQDGSYMGRLRPDDALAREIAEKNGWEE